MTSTPGVVIDGVDGRRIRIGTHWLVDWDRGDHLGFDLDPEISDAVRARIRGAGSGQSPTDGSWLYPRVEERLTDLLAAPDALVLPATTHPHRWALPVLVGSGTLLVATGAHQGIQDGAGYARRLGATVHHFDNGDLDGLADLLRTSTRGGTGQDAGPRLVCLDGVSGTGGEPPDLRTLLALCRTYGATAYLDDSYGFGILGERDHDETSPYGSRGNSLVRHTGQTYEHVILAGGFSRAYSCGLAFLALPTALKRRLRPGTPPPGAPTPGTPTPGTPTPTPAPAAVLARVLAGLAVNDSRGDRIRARLYRLTSALLARVDGLGLACAHGGGTPIVVLPVAAGQDAATVARDLWRAGVRVGVVAGPAAPPGGAGIRIRLTAAHTLSHVDELVAALADLAGRGAFQRTR